MVTISGFTERQSADGKKFYALILQGGMELVLSEASGRYYATAKQASITSTFDEKTCQLHDNPLTQRVEFSFLRQYAWLLQ